MFDVWHNEGKSDVDKFPFREIFILSKLKQLCYNKRQSERKRKFPSKPHSLTVSRKKFITKVKGRQIAWKRTSLTVRRHASLAIFSTLGFYVLGLVINLLVSSLAGFDDCVIGQLRRSNWRPCDSRKGYSKNGPANKSAIFSLPDISFFFV